MEEFIKKIVRSAGEIAMERFGHAQVEYTKADALDVVTKTDIKLNKLIEGEIKKRYHQHGIISEEMDRYQEDAEYIWTIDPIDGTSNFACGIPIFVVMVSLIKDDEVVLSAIYDPSHEELAFAKKGDGAFINDKKIACSKANKLKEARGEMGMITWENMMSFEKKLLNHLHDNYIERNAFGCAGFNAINVATGRRDWVVTFNTSVWDLAPAALLMAEAGCEVTNHKGEKWKPGDRMIAANEKLHGQLLKVLKNI